MWRGGGSHESQVAFYVKQLTASCVCVCVCMYLSVCLGQQLAQCKGSCVVRLSYWKQQQQLCFVRSNFNHAHQIVRSTSMFIAQIMFHVLKHQMLHTSTCHFRHNNNSDGDKALQPKLKLPYASSEPSLKLQMQSLAFRSESFPTYNTSHLMLPAVQLLACVCVCVCKCAFGLCWASSRKFLER